MSRDPLVDMRDREDARAAYLDGLVERPAPATFRGGPAQRLTTLGWASNRCWCGERYGHDWPGRDDKAPHPRRGTS